MGDLLFSHFAQALNDDTRMFVGVFFVISIMKKAGKGEFLFIFAEVASQRPHDQLNTAGVP